MNIEHKSDSTYFSPSVPLDAVIKNELSNQYHVVFKSFSGNRVRIHGNTREIREEIIKNLCLSVNTHDKTHKTDIDLEIMNPIPVQPIKEQIIEKKKPATKESKFKCPDGCCYFTPLPR